jgi:hypothetical protein
MSLSEIKPKGKANPALLTRSEIDWLLGKKDVSKTYEYYLRSTLKKKLTTFQELELPLLVEKGFIETQALNLSANSKDLSADAKDRNGLFHIRGDFTNKIRARRLVRTGCCFP